MHQPQKNGRSMCTWIICFINLFIYLIDLGIATEKKKVSGRYCRRATGLGSCGYITPIPGLSSRRKTILD